MKRSEMLELIKKQWVDSTSFPTDTAVAEYILDAIENAGMLPPRIKDITELMKINKFIRYDDNIYDWEKE